MKPLASSFGEVKTIKGNKSIGGRFSLVMKYINEAGATEDKDMPILAISSVEILDAESYSNWGAKAGWAVAGGLLTGGIGLIAGAIFAGNKNEKVYRVAFSKTEWIIFSASRKEAMKLGPDFQRAIYA